MTVCVRGYDGSCLLCELSLHTEIMDRGLSGRRKNAGGRPVGQTKVVMPGNWHTGTFVLRAGMLVVLAFLQVALERAFRTYGGIAISLVAAAWPRPLNECWRELVVADFSGWTILEQLGIVPPLI